MQSLSYAIRMDFNFVKLRFLRRYGMPLVDASAFALPFKDSSFDCVISSQVIEHILFNDSLFAEIRRVLRVGGTLILGTPDYATIGRRIIEPVYGFLMSGGQGRAHHALHDGKLTAFCCSTESRSRKPPTLRDDDPFDAASST